MKDESRSRTAEGVAALRATHLLDDDPTVFEDPFAIELTSPLWRRICSTRLLRRPIANVYLGALRPIQAVVLARSRYAEDRLHSAVGTGVRQYVLLGAGLDSFALRCGDLGTVLKVFELDHPASQESKRSKLARLDVPIPAHLEFVPVDFERQTAAQALQGSSFSRDERAFFSWLGTVPYLTHDAVFNTFDSIADLAAPGSEIVFDYTIPKDQIDASTWRVARRLQRLTARRGESLMDGFDPKTFPAQVCRSGFELVEHLSPGEQESRYFAGREDDLHAAPGVYFALFRVS